MIIEFKLDGCPNINLNSRVHHFKQAKEMSEWKQYVFIKAFPFKPTIPFKKAKIKIVRYFSSPNKFRDYDNLVACMKPVVDGLKAAGIIVDDNYEATGQWSVSQIKTKEKSDYLMVTVKEWENEFE